MISCAGALLFVLSVAHGAGQAATNYVELIQSDRPAAYWRCDASGSSEHAAVNSGTVSKVAIGATYRGEVEFVEGLPGTSGKAAKFNGRIAHIHVPKVNALRLDTLSIEFWFKSTQKFENTFWPGSAAFVTIATSGDGSSDFTINAASTRQGDDQGRLLFSTGPAGTGHDYLLHSPTGYRLNDGRWHHVVATRTVTGEKHLYIDGRLAASVPDPGGTIFNDRAVQIGGE